MGMNFCVANTIEDARYCRKPHYTVLSHELANFIYHKIDNIPIFNEVEPYDHVVFSSDKIEEFIVTCESMLNDELIELLQPHFVRDGIEKEEYIDILTSIIEVCKIALEKGMNIVTLGIWTYP